MSNKAPKQDSLDESRAIQLDLGCVSGEGEISMKRALEIDLILQCIFETFDFPTLKSCRLVNKRWRTLATHQILRQDLSIILLKYKRADDQFHRSTQHEDTNSSHFLYYPSIHQFDTKLSSLNEILSHSTAGDVFPCTNFTISGGNLGGVEVQQFFKIQGAKIRTLSLHGEYVDGEGDRTSKSVFCSLFHQLPLLENLSIGQFSYQFRDTEDFPPFTFLFLKTFSWEKAHRQTFAGLDPSSLPLAILKASPNLRLIRSFAIQLDLDIVSKAGKLWTIEDLQLNLKYFHILLEQLQTFLKPSSNFPTNFTRLRSLKFENIRCEPYLFHIFREEPLTSENQCQLYTLLGKLFELSQNTLEYLELSSFFSDFPKFQILPLPKLKRLRPGHKCPRGTHSKIVFPKGISLGLTFPNLRVLDCSQLYCWDDKMWPICFPPDGANLRGEFKTVETLQLEGYCTKFWMNQLRLLCPNFRKLIISKGFDTPNSPGGQMNGGRGNFDCLSQVFESWDFLEELELRVRHTILVLNSALTGIGMEDCRLILGGNLNKEEVEERMRGKVSIRRMKRLKRLKIVLTPALQNSLAFKAEGWSKEEKLPQALNIAQLYAFNLMPDQQVIIQADLHNPATTPTIQGMLLDVSCSPSVTIEHKKLGAKEKNERERVFI